MSWTTASATGVLLGVPALRGVAENVLACIARFTVPACHNAKLFDGTEHGALQEKVCEHVASFGRCAFTECSAERVYRYYCKEATTHRICEACWRKPVACGFDCSDALCPACTFEDVLCSSCGDTLPHCGRPSCETRAYECCTSADDKTLCNECSGNREKCAHCMRTLCDSCEDAFVVRCDHSGCTDKQRICSGCSDGRPSTMWFYCQCGRVECDDHSTSHACVTCTHSICERCTECDDCCRIRERNEKSRAAALVHATALAPAAPLVPAPAPTTHQSVRKRKAASK